MVLIAELEAAIVFPAETGNSSEVLSLQVSFMEALTNQGYRITDRHAKRLFCSFRHKFLCSWVEKHMSLTWA